MELVLNKWLNKHHLIVWLAASSAYIQVYFLTANLHWWYLWFHRNAVALDKSKTLARKHTILLWFRTLAIAMFGSVISFHSRNMFGYFWDSNVPYHWSLVSSWIQFTFPETNTSKPKRGNSVSCSLFIFFLPTDMEKWLNVLKPNRCIYASDNVNRYGNPRTFQNSLIEHPKIPFCPFSRISQLLASSMCFWWCFYLTDWPSSFILSLQT